ncbi:MAG: PspC family transcriptional regulator [Bacteroidia bacterium]|nr:PspC family transcriptional regulator [Bacteroidia bacterium]
MNKIIFWFEQNAFGVCESIGKRLGIQPVKIRKYFIYLSFFTFGSPVIIYFVLYFLKENKKWIIPHKRYRRSIIDMDLDE